MRVRLVVASLNMHTATPLHETFEAKESQRLAELIEFHCTSQREIWLNEAECEVRARMGSD